MTSPRDQLEECAVRTAARLSRPVSAESLRKVFDQLWASSRAAAEMESEVAAKELRRLATQVGIIRDAVESNPAQPSWLVDVELFEPPARRYLELPRELIGSLANQFVADAGSEDRSIIEAALAEVWRLGREPVLAKLDGLSEQLDELTDACQRLRDLSGQLRMRDGTPDAPSSTR